MCYDVVIVGAGPAGSYCAYLLAKAGARVLILEKSRLPRDKVCAGALSAGTVSLLDFDISHLVKSKTERAILAFGERRRRFSLRTTAGYTVERREFDYFLTEKAARAGAKIIESQKVISVSSATSPAVYTESERYDCDFIVIATGSAPGILRRLRFAGTPRFAFAATCTLARGNARSDEFLFDFAAAPCGYGWVFPKGESVSIGVYSLKVRGRKLLSHLFKFLSPHTSAREKIIPKVAPVTLPSRHLRLQNRLLPIGDSFGAADPFTGKGIYGALKTATLAADAITSSPQNATSTYLTSALPHLEDMLFSLSLSRLLYTQAELAYETVMRLPASLSSFSAAVADMTTYRKALVQSLAGLGIFPFAFPRRHSP
jgi:geranylgeranyl reductase family protein